jgi:hypothetical protein
MISNPAVQTRSSAKSRNLPVRAEPVQALPFLAGMKKRESFDKLAHNGSLSD